MLSRLTNIKSVHSYDYILYRLSHLRALDIIFGIAFAILLSAATYAVLEPLKIYGVPEKDRNLRIIIIVATMLFAFVLTILYLMLSGTHI